MCNVHSGILITDHYDNKIECPHCKLATTILKLDRAKELVIKDIIGSKLDRALHYIETGEE
jgi:hypothetical protein